MECRKAGIRQLFLRMFHIGCIGFGGGNALIPVMHKALVEDGKLVSSQDFEEDVVVASITPGALPVEIAGGIGSRLAGWQGMLLGAGGMALPGVLLTVVGLSWIAELDSAVRLQVEFVTLGILAFIACLLMDYLATTVRRASSNRARYGILAIIAIVFLLTGGKTMYRFLGLTQTPFFGIATVHVFVLAFFLILYLHNSSSGFRRFVGAVLCLVYALSVGRNDFLQIWPWAYVSGGLMLCLAVYGFLGGIRVHAQIKLDGARTAREILALLLGTFLAAIPAMAVVEETLLYLRNGMASSLISFGGGDAYLTVADGLFVDTGLISEDAFFGMIVPLVNLLPGSILCKTLSAIGYVIGYQQGGILPALLVATAGFLCSLAASCGVFSLVRCIYLSFGEWEIFRAIRRLIRPIVSGLMLTVILALAYQARKLGLNEGMGWFPVGLMAVLFACDSYLYFERKMSHVKLLVFSVAVSVFCCNGIALGAVAR